MVIVLPDGTTILESGDPDFQSIVDLGAGDPTNAVLDPSPNKPLTQIILEAFNIPFANHPNQGRPLGGTLPGFDIKNQDATTVMKLSLAVELLDPDPSRVDNVGVSNFAEVELDEFGIARFFIVGQELASNLDIRYCVPTSNIINPADLVIVRGYDPPPKRELRTSFDGLKNAEVFAYEDCAAGSCEETAVGKFASVAYDDPLLDQVYLDDVINSYELQAFETLIGYIIDLDLPSGADQDDPNYIPGLKITFGDTSKEYVTMPVSLFNNAVRLGTVSEGSGSSGGIFIPDVTVLGAGPALTSIPINFGRSGSTNAIVTVVDEKTGECTVTNVTLAGSKITIPASRFERLNKYGEVESDFSTVQDVVLAGQKIMAITSFGTFVSIFVKPEKDLVRLQQGKNWTWTVDIDGNVEIELFSIIEDDFTAFICNTYREPPSGFDFSIFTIDQANGPPIAVGAAALDGLVCNIGDRLGYRSVNLDLCVVVERKRPSIDIFDPLGNADVIATDLVDPNTDTGITYTPVVIVDEPQPIAYAATQVLANIDNTRTLPAEGIIDQADGIVDADPTTTQDLEDSEMSVLQDNTNGATIDITLPFCSDTECLQIARNFLTLQTEEVRTQSVILGPDSEPKLGQVLPDGSIINEIQYSYSDSSQYLITVSAGPKFLSAGSFQDQRYQLRTEDVTREGTVLQDKGNGAEYVVRVEGFGEITALSFILDQISVGDKVNVRIYNNPVERI